MVCLLLVLTLGAVIVNFSPIGRRAPKARRPIRSGLRRSEADRHPALRVAGFFRPCDGRPVCERVAHGLVHGADQSSVVIHREHEVAAGVQLRVLGVLLGTDRLLNDLALQGVDEFDQFRLGHLAHVAHLLSFRFGDSERSEPIPPPGRRRSPAEARRGAAAPAARPTEEAPSAARKEAGGGRGSARSPSASFADRSEGPQAGAKGSSRRAPARRLPRRLPSRRGMGGGCQAGQRIYPRVNF
jgi:hypothetical protein